jgi:nitroreductase
MNEAKRAAPDHAILPLLTERYSPYAFDPRPVESEKLQSCLEAARWAASSFNEQPWTFLVARRENAAEFQKMLECLVDSNQAWAKNAGVLMITVAARAFTRNGNPNRVAEHDVGLAMGNLTMQATALGLAVHQMAGVNLGKARVAYGIPEGHDPLTGVAIGYAGAPENAPTPQLADRERAPRTRKKISQIAFEGGWGRPLSQ